MFFFWHFLFLVLNFHTLGIKMLLPVTISYTWDFTCFMSVFVIWYCLSNFLQYKLLSWSTNGQAKQDDCTAQAGRMKEHSSAPYDKAVLTLQKWEIFGLVGDKYVIQRKWSPISLKVFWVLFKSNANSKQSEHQKI